MPTTRRGNGEGSIYKRKDGRWAADISLPGAKRKTLYGKTREQVRDKLRAAQQSLAAGLNLPSDRVTVARFSAEWLKSKKPNLRVKSYEQYESILRLHIVPALGRQRLARVKPTDLTTLYGKLLDSGLSQTTVRHVHKVIRGMLGDAYRWDYVVRNVAELVTPPKPSKRDVPVFSIDEAKRFISTARQSEHEALYVVAATTGARSAELLGLTWDAVDLDEQVIHIGKALQYQGGKPSLVEPKTKASVREIALTGMAVDSLRRQRTKQDTQALSLGPAWQNSMNLVFTNTVGSPLDRHNVLKRGLRPLLKEAGLDAALRFHDLRHIAASLALGQGLPVTLVSQMLGHASVATTLNVYAHVIPGTQRQVADEMERLLA
jgi:integrase